MDETLKKLRGRIPSMECIPGCSACCGHVPWSKHEFEALSPENKERLRTFTLKCPFAVDGRCDIHSDRPITCRIFGVTEGLPCPRGVQTVDILDTETITALMKEYSKTFFEGGQS